MLQATSTLSSEVARMHTIPMDGTTADGYTVDSPAETNLVKVTGPNGEVATLSTALYFYYPLEEVA